jgi:hypothetical protein
MGGEKMTAFPKNKPYRSKAFLKFCHELGGRCALCGRQFEELHHFGNDGGKGLKPSDSQIVRLCRPCHMGNDFKERSLLRSGKFEELISFQRDALELNRAYIEHLEGKR